ncbi:MAG: hypothetical protein KatS3mg114_0370 [Planctomycetaceae bacterium]|nr:MAG: hypothetical protein KatS3mg114_0370 [Planctomycetaceae bacterium]
MRYLSPVHLWKDCRQSWQRLSHEHRANSLAALVALTTVGWLILKTPPTPVAADGVRPTKKNTRLVAHRLASPRDCTPTHQATLAPHPSPDPLASPTPLSDAQPSMPAYERTLRYKISLLEQGREFLQRTPAYTAEFSKQELVDGELLDEVTMFMKCRHQPFSIYFHWLTGDAGRELIYVEGNNNNKLLVHGGGWKARLPSLLLDPSDPMVMKECRYPVTSAGLLALTEIILKIHREDLMLERVDRCEQLPDESFDERPCYTFLTTYKNREVSPLYRKSLVMIDKEWKIPVFTRNHTWPEGDPSEDEQQLDDETLIEQYSYSELSFEVKLAEQDFDRHNEEYRFR